MEQTIKLGERVIPADPEIEKKRPKRSLFQLMETGNLSSEETEIVPQVFYQETVPLPAVMSEDEYLSLKGVGDPVSDYLLDKMRCNRSLRTEKGKKRFEKEAQEALDIHSEKRKAARIEYKDLLKAGVIRKPTKEEVLIRKANGHPDNASTQAARRMCQKRGIDWKNAG